MHAAAATLPEHPLAPASGELASRRRAALLEWLTIGWNLLEVGVTVSLGLAAHSLALIAFGTDSLVEVFASLVVVWHLADGGSQSDRRRSAALRLVAVAFGLLAALLVAGAVHGLVSRERPHSSPVGIAYLAVTALVMFGLAKAKRGVAGTTSDGEPLAAEAWMTFLDGWVAITTLAALAANAWLGWWWADAVAAAIIAAVAGFEAWSGWREAAMER